MKITSKKKHSLSPLILEDKTKWSKNKEKSNLQKTRKTTENIYPKVNVVRAKVKKGEELIKFINSLGHRIKKVRIVFEELLWEVIKCYLMIKGLIAVIEKFM